MILKFRFTLFFFVCIVFYLQISHNACTIIQQIKFRYKFSFQWQNSFARKKRQDFLLKSRGFCIDVELNIIAKMYKVHLQYSTKSRNEG